MNTSKRWALIALVSIVAFTAVVWGIRGGGVEVTLAVVSRDTLSVTLPVEGRTRARDSFTISSPVAGRLARLDLDEGDTVVEGQVLARLYPAPDDPRARVALRAAAEGARARLEEAETRLQEAELNHEQAAREVERRRPLVELGAVTREAMEQAELAAVLAEERLTGARATLAASRAELRGAEARLLGGEGDPSGETAEIVVQSPASGRVLRIPDESERVVGAGVTLLVVAAQGGTEVVLDVLSEDAVQVSAGQALIISRWGGDHVLTGTVEEVTMAGYTKVSTLGVEEQRVDVVATLHDPPATLGTGYRVSGEIVTWSGADRLTVPTSALFRVGAEWMVFVAEGGRARIRPVIVGQRNDRVAEVVEGLVEGDAVVDFPSEDVSDGVRIRYSGDGGTEAR